MCPPQLVIPLLHPNSHVILSDFLLGVATVWNRGAFVGRALELVPRYRQMFVLGLWRKKGNNVFRYRPIGDNSSSNQ